MQTSANPKPVALHSVDHGGAGKALVILHGLFGSSRNWTQAARELSGSAHVYTLDLRNHGESPHHPNHRIEDLSADLLAWMDSAGLQRPIVLGHSMGGMAAMHFASLHPERCQALIVVDIAPRIYAPHHQREFAALSIDLNGLDSRQAIDQRMAALHPSPMVRQFLQMNLERGETGYRWRLNIDALRHADVTGAFALPETTYGGPSLFIAGGASDYIQPEDHALIGRYFPNAKIETIPGADHWLHHTAQAEFLKLVREFLSGLGAAGN